MPPRAQDAAAASSVAAAPVPASVDQAPATGGVAAAAVAAAPVQAVEQLPWTVVGRQDRSRNAGAKTATAPAAAPASVSKKNKRKTATAELSTPMVTPDQPAIAKPTPATNRHSSRSEWGATTDSDYEAEDGQLCRTPTPRPQRAASTGAAGRSSLASLPSPQPAAQAAAAQTPKHVKSRQRKDISAAASSSSGATVQRSLSFAASPSLTANPTHRTASISPMHGSSESVQASGSTSSRQ